MRTKKTDILVKDLQQKEKEQDVLLCISSSIAAIRNREDLSGIVKDNVLDLFNGKYYMLCLISEDKIAHTPFIFSSDEKLAGDPGFKKMITTSHPLEDGMWDVILASKQPLIYDIGALQKRFPRAEWLDAWHRAGMREMTVTAFSGGRDTKGFFCLYAAKSGAFPREKSGLLQAIASLAGTGIGNVLANEKIEQQLKKISEYKQQLEDEHLYLLEENNAAINFSEVVGSGAEMQKVFRLISQVAPSDSSVLLLGETGTGKELVARAIHNASGRSNKLMIKLNCAALPAPLIESELFGHERGSFTGASERRIGKFELAANSTLFLDEIGELPLELQVKLLRVLQEKEIERLGGRETIKVNVRIIAATNRHLQKEVDAGRFRSDLFYRLNVFPILLPPLRKRKEDIPVLVSHFIERYAKNAGKKIKNISQVALDSLLGYAWPGNVRELEHLIERSVLLTSGATIRKIDLPASAVPRLINEIEFIIKPLNEMERDYILKVIKQCGGRISGVNGAAVKLGLPSTTLISKMQKLKIKKEHFVEK